MVLSAKILIDIKFVYQNFRGILVKTLAKIAHLAINFYRKHFEYFFFLSKNLTNVTQKKCSNFCKKKKNFMNFYDFSQKIPTKQKILNLYKKLFFQKLLKNRENNIKNSNVPMEKDFMKFLTFHQMNYKNKT